MEMAFSPELLFLRDELEKQLKTLKNNRDKVPLEVLKTKYKKGYEALCGDIREKASEYATQATYRGIRIHRDFVKEGLAIIEGIVKKSEYTRELSYAVFARQDMEEINCLIEKIRQQIFEALKPYEDGERVLIGGTEDEGQ